MSLSFVELSFVVWLSVDVSVLSLDEGGLAGPCLGKNLSNPLGSLANHHDEADDDDSNHSWYQSPDAVDVSLFVGKGIATGSVLLLLLLLLIP